MREFVILCCLNYAHLKSYSNLPIYVEDYNPYMLASAAHTGFETIVSLLSGVSFGIQKLGSALSRPSVILDTEATGTDFPPAAADLIIPPTVSIREIHTINHEV